MSLSEKRLVITVAIYTDEIQHKLFELIREPINDAVEKTLKSCSDNKYVFRNLSVELKGYEK